MDILLPTLFLSHGPGPLWILNEQPSRLTENLSNSSPEAEYLKNLVKSQCLPKPIAILVVSAHFEEKTFTVTTNPNPPMLYDYYGFSDDAYKVKWPAPGSPGIAKRVREVLETAGLSCSENPNRGYDHGTFVPLSLVYPKADIPVVQLSLKSNLNIEEHLKLGEALKPLRKEGILIIGSGHTTHSGSFKDGPTPAWKDEFTTWINDVITNTTYSSNERKKLLLESESQKSFSSAHPRSEHYLPLVVVAAASGYVQGAIIYENTIMKSLVVSHIRFE